jgi:uncharacterized membrane protein
MKACMTGAMSLFAATMVILALTACGGGGSAREEAKARPLPQDPDVNPAYDGPCGERRRPGREPFARQGIIPKRSRRSQEGTDP